MRMAWYSNMLVKAPGFPAVPVGTRYGYPNDPRFKAPRKIWTPAGKVTLSKKQRSELTTLIRKWHRRYGRGSPYLLNRMGRTGHVHRYCRVIYNHIPDLS